MTYYAEVQDNQYYNVCHCPLDPANYLAFLMPLHIMLLRSQLTQYLEHL